MMIRQLKWFLASAASLLVLGAEIPVARADLKMEQTVTTSSTPAPDGKVPDVTTGRRTLFFKAGKQRTDAGGTVEILDYAMNKRVVMNPKDKTFYETAVSYWMTDSQISKATFSGDVTVTDTKEEKKIAGKTARHYKYGIRFTLNDPQHSETSFFSPTVELTGDQWTVEEKNNGKQPQISPDLRQVMMQVSSQVMPPGKKWKDIKGIPVDGVQFWKISVSPSAPQELQPSIYQTVVTTTTNSIIEAALPDSLFEVPNTYKKIDAPEGK